MTPYELLFADQPLDQLLLEVEFPPGSRLDVARARMWEGHLLEAAEAASGGGQPWATFIMALARKNAGQSAERALRQLAEDSFGESRARLLAWTALRDAGVKPPASQASQVLGCIIEVPVDDGLDVLAAYADGSTRFLSHGGEVILHEMRGDPPDDVSKLLAEAYPLLAVPPAPRDPEAEEPPPDRVRLSALSANGLHQVTVGWPEVEAGEKWFSLFRAAAHVLDRVTSV